MRFTRFLVAILGVALLGMIPVGLTTTSAGAADGDKVAELAKLDANARAATFNTRLKMSKLRNKYNYGNKIRVRGGVQAYGQCTDGSVGWCAAPDTSNGKVILYRRSFGKSTWYKTRTRLNERSFSITVKAKRNSVYKVVYTGGNFNGHTLRASSASNGVKVSRHLHGRGMKSKGKLYYKGNVDPGWGKKKVVIQKKKCKKCKWRKFKTIRTTRSGAYKTRIYAPRSGSWYFRSTVRKTGKRFIRGYGRTTRTYRY